MLCQDVMRRPVECCKDKDTVETAARKMRESNIGFLPVCDEASRVVGVLTDRDIVVRVCALGLKPHKTRTSEVMTRDVVGCRPGDDLKRAQELMVKFRKSRIVVWEEGKLAGVISLADIATRDQPFTAETLREVAAREVLDVYGHLTAHH